MAFPNSLSTCSSVNDRTESVSMTACSFHISALGSGVMSIDHRDESRPIHNQDWCIAPVRISNSRS